MLIIRIKSNYFNYYNLFFLQARPVDYAPEYLKSSQQISFHKHWMIDPLKVYEQWFQNADLQMIKEDRTHIEL